MASLQDTLTDDLHHLLVIPTSSPRLLPVPSQACSGSLLHVWGALPECDNRHLISLTKPDTRQHVAGLARESKCPLHLRKRQGQSSDNLPGRASAGTPRNQRRDQKVQQGHVYLVNQAHWRRWLLFGVKIK